MLSNATSYEMSKTHRRATHAGSWYSNNAHVLNEELTTWLAQATSLPSSKEPSCHVPAPISHAIGLIAPHAGYRYSGPTAAYAYAALDTSTIDRVILLGPTHHEFIDGCALSQCDVFETPLGSFEAADLTEFNKSGLFSPLSMKADEKEHSLEMQLPYLYKRFKDDGRPIPKLVMILVGQMSPSGRVYEYAEFLAKQSGKSTGWIVSTDFCHFGPRFRYTPTFTHFDCIHQGIEHMDREGMEHVQRLEPFEFEMYLKRTQNTICGRAPLLLFMHLLVLKKKNQPLLVWTHYDQSTRIQKDPSDHSVSYVSGYVVVQEEAS